MGLTSQEERGRVAIPIDNLVTGEWEVVGSKGKLLSFKGFRRGRESDHLRRLQNPPIS